MECSPLPVITFAEARVSPSRLESQRTLRESLKDVERETILRALTETKWNRTKAAKHLEIDGGRVLENQARRPQAAKAG